MNTHIQATDHAFVRAQQRGIPPLIQDWLLDFGDESHDGHGAVIRYFSKRTVRRLERSVGRLPVRRMAEYLRSYLVQANDGTVITVGKRHRHRRILRN